MGVTFLHTADFHLGSPLRAVEAASESLAERLQRATHEALRRVIQVAIDEDIDFVVLVMSHSPRGESLSILPHLERLVYTLLVGAQVTKYSVDDVVDELCTHLENSGAQWTSRLPEWEDFQELAEEYEVTV